MAALEAHHQSGLWTWHMGIAGHLGPGQGWQMLPSQKAHSKEVLCLACWSTPDISWEAVALLAVQHLRSDVVGGPTHAVLLLRPATRKTPRGAIRDDLDVSITSP